MVKGYAKTEQVQTTLTPRWRDRLDAYAAEREQSRADAIRTLVTEGLDRDWAAQPRRVVIPTDDAEPVEFWQTAAATADGGLQRGES